ncbi:hypothetical protein DVH24_022533 [Malus domestica]|uniref:Uncharacterized protein n=1 Tax=Malus domestica TaxID=3750 RepID=A0A498KJM7_MALDO|nr:hypothetical protein DVH24_022533 [Malus domestica]
MKPRTRASARTAPFEAISGQTTASWPACKKLYSFESYPVSGESDGFRGIFRTNRRVRRRVRYHSLRLFKGYNFHFCLA